jgi:hypothetical protein
LDHAIDHFWCGPNFRWYVVLVWMFNVAPSSIYFARDCDHDLDIDSDHDPDPDPDPDHDLDIDHDHDPDPDHDHDLAI